MGEAERRLRLVERVEQRGFERQERREPRGHAGLEPIQANVGLDSGLENRRSDFVGRFQLSPNQNISFISRARFDQRS
jgi:hypothetical protein